MARSMSAARRLTNANDLPIGGEFQIPMDYSSINNTGVGAIGFYLPPMDKSDLFKTVILDGALPRKTFSMGEACEKRFYMECRRIN